MANAYIDNYSLDGAPRRKADLYNYLNTNRDRLNLTPEEEYKFNWGSEAVSDDWITQKAKSIQQEIEDSNSTAILRRGLGNSKAASDEVTDEIEAGKTPEEIEAEKAKAGGSQTRDTSTNDPANDPGWDTSFGWSADQANAKLGASPVKSALGFAASPGAAILGYIGSGITQNSQPNAERQAVMDARAAGLTAEANAMKEQAFNKSINDMEAGYGRGVGGYDGAGNYGGGSGGNPSGSNTGTGDGSNGGRDSNSQGPERGHG